MNDMNHYSDFLMKGPHGFAHQKVVTDNDGKPVDYVFLEVNEAFERLTGLKAKNIINKKVTEVIPGIEKNEFDWIAFYGNVALQGLEEEFEQFSAPLKRWYKGYAYSTRKGYFATMFSDISPDRFISEASRKFMEYTSETLDYRYIVDTMQAISGAAFVVLNRFEPDGKDFTTQAIAGHPKSIEHALKTLGLSLQGRLWKHDPEREAKISNATTTRFNKLGELVGSVIPKNLIRLIEATFKTGQCAIVKTSKGKTNIGDFTLIYHKGQQLKNQAQLEIYADMVGMLFSRLEAEAGIKVHKEELELLLENIGTQIWYLKNVNTYGAVNKAHADFMGCQKSDLEHKDLFDLLSKEEADICLHGNRRVFEEKQVVFTDEWRILNGNGEKRLLHITKNPKLDKNGNVEFVICTAEDITERKRAEESLQERNLFVEKVLASIPEIIIYIFDLPTQQNVYSSKGMFNILGYTSEEFKAMGEAVLKKTIHPDDLEPFFVYLNSLKELNEGDVRSIEYRMKHKNGHWVWILNFDTIYTFDKAGNPLQTIGSAQDITDRKNAEEKILENEQRFNLAISGTGAGLWDWDMVKNKVFFSPYWKEMLGYKDHEVENDFLGWKRLWHPDDAAKIEKAISDHLEGKTQKYEIEHRLKQKDGSWCLILTRGDIIKDKNGKPLRWVGTNIDLTENKKLTLEVQQQSSLISSLLDSIPDIISFKDKDGVYLGCNLPFAEFVGRPREEIIGHTDYDLFSKENADFFRKHDKKMLDEMESRHNEEWITYPDGRTILIDTLKTPYYGPGGKLIGILGISRDITDRKKAEEAIIQAREQAQAASKAKSEFLANMSHEIRTPLNGVIGFTDLLKNTQLTTMQRQYLENANTSAHLLLGIISDILDLSKIESGKLELDPVKTDIIELTAQAIDIVKYKASEKGLEMLLNIQSGMPRFIVVDPIRLKQVLVNLLGNAVKFTEKGEVELKVEFSKTNQQRGSFHFSVRDTGIGIEKSKQEKLFDAFFQADASTTRRFGGTGLGLQISKLLIDKMKGNIGVESVYGKGSTFFFKIETKFEAGENADKQPIAAIERTLVTDLNNITNPVFLVVEDVFLNMALMKAVLQEILPNAVIHEASNGQQALDLVVSEPKIDLIFMDVQMPVMDGLEATRRIRALEKESDKSIPIIALTAGVVKGEKEKCLEAGMNNFLAKPLNQLLLRKKIQIYLDTESTKAENAEHSPVMFDKHFDIAGVMERSGVNQLLVIEIASKSLTSIGNYLQKLKAAIENENSEEREMIAHSLKGISLNMGFSKMSILAEKTELIENSNAWQLLKLHAAMCKELTLLNELVKQHAT